MISSLFVNSRIYLLAIQLELAIPILIQFSWLWTDGVSDPMHATSIQMYLYSLGSLDLCQLILPIILSRRSRNNNNLEHPFTLSSFLYLLLFRKREQPVCDKSILKLNSSSSTTYNKTTNVIITRPPRSLLLHRWRAKNSKLSV